jgi:dihydropteroate synthase
MGILNVTADSFSDGGRYFENGQLSIDLAMRQARDMVKAGVSIIDVGGESTRPGAQAVSEQEELDRVVPVVERICAELEVIVSVDTSSPAVMEAAAKAGAGLINDVRALQRPGALEALVSLNLPVCLMHMQGEPGTMQRDPAYQNVVTEVKDFLLERAHACIHAGLAADKILIDPGFGFGKTLAHNLQLLRSLSVFTDLNFPVLVGLSRKSMIDKLLQRPIDQRLPGSLTLALLAVQAGARILRVHDVAATQDVLQIWMAIDDNGGLFTNH